MSNLLKTNTFKIVGKLTAAEVEQKTKTTDGSTYVIVNAVVVSNIGGVENDYEVSFYANQLTADKKISTLFSQYVKMPDLIGKKVEVSGSIRSNRFYSARTDQMANAQTLSGRFIHGVADSIEDSAIFEVGGFLVSALTEKKNKQNEIYAYEVGMGVANYSEDNMSLIILHIRPNDREIINGLKNYQVGDTFTLNGSLNFITTVVTQEDSGEGGFGQKVVRTFTNKQKNFWVEGGSAKVSDPEEAYSSALVRTLTSAFKAKDVEIQNNAKTNAKPTAAPVEDAPVITNRQAGLI